MKIDAHQHFWHYTAAEYGWIDASMSALHRDYLPADLQREIESVGIEGVVAVQARQSLEETRWLLELASKHAFIRGVVGWLPLADANIGQLLDQYAGHPWLKAVRHVLHDEPEKDFILGEAFNAGVAALRETGLVYDILIFERQLPQAVKFVDRHPQQAFVVDHLAKPRIQAGQLEPWRSGIRALAERKNVYCKISGMTTEADWGNWEEPQLMPYFEVVLEAFGPRRLMFGSDWPVCRLACTYQQWYEIVRRFCAGLSQAEQAHLLGTTAVEVYQLEPHAHESLCDR